MVAPSIQCEAITRAAVGRVFSGGGVFVVGDGWRARVDEFTDLGYVLGPVTLGVGDKGVVGPTVFDCTGERELEFPAFAEVPALPEASGRRVCRGVEDGGAAVEDEEAAVF